MQIWTVGHSTHTLDEFLALLAAQRIEILADVRSFPGSRKYPHFGRTALEQSLRAAGVRYEHLPELGGRRRVAPNSHNTAWRNASFRGYADYMETPAFQAGIDRLLALAGTGRTAYMCAEAVWWRCHRGLISDYLKVRGVDVLHIISETQTQPHPYTSAARIADGRWSYTAETQAPLFE